MTITLNHTIVPARDKTAAAKFFARIFGLKRARTDYFAPVCQQIADAPVRRRLEVREPSLRFPCQQPRVRRYPRPHQEGENHLRQRALEPRRRQAQRLERRPRGLLSGPQRARARAHDRAAV